MLNSKRNVYISILYFIIGAAYIFIFRMFRIESPIEPFIKTFPIWLLLIPAWYSLKKYKGGFFLMIGLLFGSAGDFILSSKIQHAFLIGLVLFLVGHIFYIFAFLRVFHFKPFRMIPAGMVVLAMVIIVFQLAPYINQLQIAIYSYMAVIFLMSFLSSFRDSSYPAVFIGAALFLLSDSLLAFNKFASADMPDFLIMATYYLAQYLVIIGSVGDSEIQSVVEHV